MNIILVIFFLIFSITNCFVIELTDSDFESRLKGREAFVMFYSPNCGHCARIKPTIETLASKKNIIQSGVLIVKVDCTDKGKMTCGKYKVNGYPTLKYISKVDSETSKDYDGNRELEDLETFIIFNHKPSISEILESEVDQFISPTTHPCVLGFFKDSKSKLYSQLSTLSSEEKKYFNFGYTFSSEIAEKLGQKLETVVIYRQQKFKSPNEESTLMISSDKLLKKFLSDNRHSIVDIRTPSNEEDFLPPLINVILPLDPDLQRSTFRRFRNSIIRLAKVNIKVKFTISTRDAYKSFVEEISPQGVENAVFIVGYDTNAHRYVNVDQVSIGDHKNFEATLLKFTSDFIKGGVLERHIKSEKIPPSQEGYVTTVVGRTFDQIVLDEEKDVLIEFYAPWCGHCKKLAPIYEELASALKDEKNIVIAKMDATANELHKDFSVEGYPTIYFSKAGRKPKPINYDGKRDAKSMLEWLKSHATHPIKYDGPISSKDEL